MPKAFSTLDPGGVQGVLSEWKWLRHLRPVCLGEFDQKGAKSTKWGTKEELLSLTAKPRTADHKEMCRAEEVDNADRTQKKYHWYHFSGIDYDAKTKKTAIYKILGDDTWAESVDDEKGNYDYLMFADLDYDHPEVRQGVINWGKWLSKEVDISGIRFDAVKHFSKDFLLEFNIKMDEARGDGWFFVGEFWKGGLDDMSEYLTMYGHEILAVSCAPRTQFLGDEQDSRSRSEKSVRWIIGSKGANQRCEAAIEPVLSPCVLIFLRYDGYTSVFWGDLYGMDPVGDKQNISAAILRGGSIGIGWVRYGTLDRRFGCATVLSNAGPGKKRMHVGGYMQAMSVLGWSDRKVVIEDDDCSNFVCPGTSVSVWVNKDAEGRDRFREFEECL
ncbi:hypothetical protein GMDG_05601 [Pseudogymnoascus destructans 20631-21]|uniref:Glycosyl hydrolase family 13 catalytic domain-containing protein n=2 Tax=Pseudogymnoascus destructans TaxID=655981 RepID=L8FNT9_PSED2|nr:hypothetical protein GMDG_05601 [Pseudogymnoascus destructans 20631-21]